MVSPAASPSVAVDYGEVRGDFEYFLAPSTETAAQIAALRPHLERQAAGAGPIRMLDFGCGAGLFTEQLLRESAIGREHIELWLVEPVAAQLHEARARLEPWAARVGLWRDGFAQAGLPFPFPLSEDAEAAFRRLSPQARRETIRYTMTLPDQPTARRRVLRSLLGPEAVLRLSGSAESLFEPFTRDGRILIETTYPHLVVRRPDG